MAQLAISISAEPVMHVGHLAVTNSMLTSLIVSTFLIILSVWAKTHIKRTRSPKGLQNFLELFIDALYRLTEGITESSKKAKTIFPFVLSFFLFIVLNNWIGLLPGVGTIGYMEKPEPSESKESMAVQNKVAYVETPSFAPVYAMSADGSSSPSKSSLPDLMTVMAPTLISVLMIGISFWASKNVKSVKAPRGLMSFLEVIVGFFKGLFSHNWIKKAFPIAIVLYFLIEILFFTGLVPGFGIVRAPQAPAAPKQKVTAPKLPKTQPIQAQKPAVEKKQPEAKFVPYLRAGTSDLNTTLALAIISVVATQVIGVQYLGIKYFKKFFNFSGPIEAFVGILELVSEFGHIISFAFRLFGNIFAGEVLLTVIYFLVPLFVPLPFTGLEIFVGTIQGFVFATLTLVFMNMATQGHDEAHEEALA